jgi:hypothetical protein
LTWEVVGYERIAVTAGEFDTFRLVSKGSMRGTSVKNSRVEADVVPMHWYAPAARAVVTSITHNPYIGATTVELVRFHPRP